MAHSSTALSKNLLPKGLWVFREVECVSGSQENVDDVRHLSCILRDSVETTARANDETLIIAAALAQKPSGDSCTYAGFCTVSKPFPNRENGFNSQCRAQSHN